MLVCKEVEKMLRQFRKGQSTAEYAIVIGLVIAAAVAMQVYIKRGVQGKIKGAVDYKPNAMFTGDQYEPNYSESNMNVTRNVQTNINTSANGKVVRTIGDDGEVTNRSGTQSIIALDE
jgi:uncharacterized protein (UPF0333 family)